MAERDLELRRGSLLSINRHVIFTLYHVAQFNRRNCCWNASNNEEVTRNSLPLLRVMFMMCRFQRRNLQKVSGISDPSARCATQGIWTSSKAPSFTSHDAARVDHRSFQVVNMSFAIHVRIILTKPSDWQSIVEKTVWLYSNAVTWTNGRP